MSQFLEQVDNELAQLIKQERDRQAQTLGLITSKSLAPVAIMEALGSVYTNKSVAHQ